ncbi:MAG: hypothetical protein J1F05_07405 [Muribaculaceae bacterium]|nr:hypothetical protein [Muribaculaceae bacterium]
MKVLVIHHHADGNKHIEAGVDSAVLRPAEPVFVPEPFEQWQSSIVIAVRIARLGMSIKESRAKDYYNEFTAFHMLTPISAEVSDGLPPYILDRTFSPGTWLDLGRSGANIELKAECCALTQSSSEHETTITQHFDISDLEINKTIALLSKHITFKTGDLLIFTAHRLDLGAPRLDTSITATINGQPVLSIRIK